MESLRQTEHDAKGWPEDAQTAGGEVSSTRTAGAVTEALQREVGELQVRLEAAAEGQAAADARVAELKQRVAALREESDALDTAISHPESVAEAPPLPGQGIEEPHEDVAGRSTALTKESVDFKQAEAWFEAMTRALEELGGAKLVAAGPSTEGGLVVQVQLWGRHTLDLALSPHAGTDAGNGRLVIEHAQLPAALGVELADLLPVARTLPPGKDIR